MASTNSNLPLQPSIDRPLIEDISHCVSQVKETLSVGGRLCYFRHALLKLVQHLQELQGRLLHIFLPHSAYRSTQR